MMIDPKHIVFDDTADVVTYVTRGLPPTKNQFKKLLNGLNNPVEDPNHVDKNNVMITTYAIQRWSDTKNMQTVINEVLTDVYKEKVRHRNISIALCIIAAVVGTIMFRKKK